MCLRVHSNADQQQLHCIFRKALGPREVSLEEEHLSGCDLSNASEILGDPQRVLSELRTCPAPARPWSQLGPPLGLPCARTRVCAVRRAACVPTHLGQLEGQSSGGLLIAAHLKPNDAPDRWDVDRIDSGAFRSAPSHVMP